MDIVERLNTHAASRGAIPKIARLAGKHRETLDRIRRGEDARLSTIKAIEVAIAKYESSASDPSLHPSDQGAA